MPSRKSKPVESDDAPATVTARKPPIQARALSLLGGALLGLIAAIIGIVLHWCVAAYTPLPVSPVAIVVGVGVGWAVRLGTGSPGSRPKQCLALVLTYLAIALGQTAVVWPDWRGHLDFSAATLLFVLVVPFMRDVNSIFGMAIVAFGLLQSVHINRPRATARSK